MMRILTASRWNTFPDYACLVKYCELLYHNPPWESLFFETSSHIHDHHMDGKFQAYDIFEMTHLEHALHCFSSFLDVLTIYMLLSSRHIFHLTSSLMTNLRITPWLTSWSSLYLLNFLIVSILTPTYGSSIAYGHDLRENLNTIISPYGLSSITKTTYGAPCPFTGQH
jgi:hypothetical protein